MKGRPPTEGEVQEAAEALGVLVETPEGPMVDDADLHDVAIEIVARRMVVDVRLQLLANGLDPTRALDVARYLARERDGGEGKEEGETP